jgi:hypothetical protein
VHNPTPYYCCGSGQTYLRGFDRDQVDCHERLVNASTIESVVWDYVVSILADSKRFEAEWRKAQRAKQGTLAPQQSRLEVVNDLITHCEQEAAEALKRAGAGSGKIASKHGQP